MSAAPESNPPAFPYQLDETGTPTAYASVDILAADQKFVTFDFELDTGAYITTLPASAAVALGLTVTQGVPLSLGGVDGQPFQTYVHQVTARFTGQTTPFVLYVAFATFECPILLGRYMFWESLHDIFLDMMNKETVFG
jgi:hypothetical protein